MPTPTLSHNDRIARALEQLGCGNFIDFELADIYSSRWDQPIQFALRHKSSGRIGLFDLNGDGTLWPSPNPAAH